MTVCNPPGAVRAAFAAILAAGLGFAAPPAEAATCHLGKVTTDSGIISRGCETNVAGGGANEMNGYAVFGKTNWRDFGTIDLPGTSGGLLELAFDSEAKRGSWKLADGFSFDPDGHYALVLKGAPGKDDGASARGATPEFEAVFNVSYLLDTSAASGTWWTYDLRNGSGEQVGLSNLALFGTVAPIPLPAAAWLLIGGIAGLGAVARKRKAAAA